jgi:hypothetical protein
MECLQVITVECLQVITTQYLQFIRLLNVEIIDVYQKRKYNLNPIQPVANVQMEFKVEVYVIIVAVLETAAAAANLLEAAAANPPEAAAANPPEAVAANPPEAATTKTTALTTPTTIQTKMTP